MLELYRDYINQTLIPTIKSMLIKYSVWWTFKPNSSLQAYLKDHNIILHQYFTPEELYTSLISFFKVKQILVRGNDKLIMLDSKLQECFTTGVIYVPELLDYCKNHVEEIMPDTLIYKKLQNCLIDKNIIFETCEDLIFDDYSSIFWIHPEINYAMNNNNQLVYSWDELYDLFLDFCTKNNNYFIQKPDSIIYVNPLSSFAKLFKLQCFHKDQIKDVLRTCTKFLGKTNTINQYCEHFQTSITNELVFTLMNSAITYYNKYVPFLYTYVDI